MSHADVSCHSNESFGIIFMCKWVGRLLVFSSPNATSWKMFSSVSGQDETSVPSHGTKMDIGRHEFVQRQT